MHYDGNTRLVCLTALTHEPDTVYVTHGAVGCIVVGCSRTVIGMEFGLGMTNLADPIVGRRVTIIETVGTAAGGEDHRQAVDLGVDQREVRIVRIMQLVTFGAGWFPRAAGGMDRRMGQCIVALSTERIKLAGRAVDQESTGGIGRIVPQLHITLLVLGGIVADDTVCIG